MTSSEADTDKVKAIADLPQLANVQGVRTFLGIANQLSKFQSTSYVRRKASEIFYKGKQWTSFAWMMGQRF